MFLRIIIIITSLWVMSPVSPTLAQRRLTNTFSPSGYGKPLLPVGNFRPWENIQNPYVAQLSENFWSRIYAISPSSQQPRRNNNAFTPQQIMPTNTLNNGNLLALLSQINNASNNGNGTNSSNQNAGNGSNQNTTGNGSNQGTNGTSNTGQNGSGSTPQSGGTPTATPNGSNGSTPNSSGSTPNPTSSPSGAPGSEKRAGYDAGRTRGIFQGGLDRVNPLGTGPNDTPPTLSSSNYSAEYIEGYEAGYRSGYNQIYPSSNSGNNSPNSSGNNQPAAGSGQPQTGNAANNGSTPNQSDYDRGYNDGGGDGLRDGKNDYDQYRNYDDSNFNAGIGESEDYRRGYEYGYRDGYAIGYSEDGRIGTSVINNEKPLIAIEVLEAGKRLAVNFDSSIGHDTEYHISIYGLNGKLYRSAPIDASSSIDVNDMNKGIYILTIHTNNQVVYTQKIMLAD